MRISGFWNTKIGQRFCWAVLLFHYILTRLLVNILFLRYVLSPKTGRYSKIHFIGIWLSVYPTLSLQLQTWYWESQRWNWTNSHLQRIVRKESKCFEQFQGLEGIFVRRKLHLSSEQMHLHSRAHGLAIRTPARCWLVLAALDTHLCSSANQHSHTQQPWSWLYLHFLSAWKHKTTLKYSSAL